MIILIFFIAAFSGSAIAETVPATMSKVPAEYRVYNNPYGAIATTWSNPVPAAEVDALFQTHCSFLSAQSGWPRHSTPSTSNAGTGYCYLQNGPWRVDLLITQQPYCKAGTLSGQHPNATCNNVPTCPDSSWALSGTTCERQTCPAGQTWNAVSQRCRCDSGSDVGDDGKCCPQPSEQIPSMQFCYISNTTDTSCTSSAPNGCTIRCNDITFQKPKGGEQVVIGPFMALGQSCKYTGSYSPENFGGGPLSDQELRDIDNRVKEPGDEATPAGCMAAGMGYVSGSSGTTCVAAGKGGDVVKNTSSTSSNSGSGGGSGGGTGSGTGSSTKQTTTTGSNGSSTTVKTTTTQNGDGTTTTTTTTTSHNPDGSVSETVKTEKKDSSGNTVETSEKKQETTDKAEWCAKNPTDAACKKAAEDCPEGSDKAACVKLGNPDALPNPELNTVERGISAVVPVGVASSPSCPQGPPLPFGLGYMPLDGICDLATGIRPILIALAWIGAGLIVIGAFRET